MIKYIFAIVCIVNISAFEFQNLQLVDYDETSAAYFGNIDLGKFQKVGSKYYWIESVNTLSWWDAYFTCRKHKSTLATMSTVNELKEVSPHLLKLQSNGRWWIGGTDLHVEGAFRWMDSSESIPRGNLWIADQPDNAGGDENCVHLWRDGTTDMFRINDWKCYFMAFFICERETPKSVTFVAW